MIRVRFAPAPTANLPTGNLSFNSARVALANYLFALRGNGRMLLRLDDLDQERARGRIALGEHHRIAARSLDPADQRRDENAGGEPAHAASRASDWANKA